MGKSKRGERELTREQKLIHENRILKRQIAGLRKELARVDLDRYSNLKETIDKHYQEDRAQEGLNILENIKKEWACKEPNCIGFLEIFVFTKIDHAWYYRKCNCCPHRTKAQKYTPEVRGILKDSE